MRRLETKERQGRSERKEEKETEEPPYFFINQYNKGEDGV